MAEKPNLKLSGGKDANWWCSEVDRARTGWRDYRDKGKKVVKRYRDDHRDTSEQNRKRFNILYSNTETLGPAIYGQVPIPDIRRRWQDKDPVGRLAALVLQRATQFCLDSYDFDAVLDSCKQDYLLPGFAVARVRYKPYFKKTPKKDAQGAELKDEFDEELVYHESQTEYWPWDRFIMSRTRQYDRVWYVGFGDDLTKDEVTEQFGPKVAEELQYSRRPDVNISDDDKKQEFEPTARLWEIWCKRGKGRFIVSEGYDGWVSPPEPDPLRLEGFFPNAKPLWAISTTDTLEPVPEYLEYQDQAMELDDLTERIDVLTSAVRRRGVYDAEFADMASMLSNRSDNNFIPIENFGAFLSKGGMEKLAMEMPLADLIAAIIALEDRRNVVKQTIYEVTGIADIVRGSSNPNETARAQEIKGRWAGLRIDTRRKKFANFARDLVRLQAEMIAERFDAQTLSLISGMKLPTQQEKAVWTQQQQVMQQQAQLQAQQAQATGQQPPPPPKVNPKEQKFFAQPTWEEVLAVLRSDKLRGFKIDIETDSTVQPDADGEKQARTEFLTAIGQYARETGYAIPPNLSAQAIAFAARAFKAGSQMEDILEEMENTAPGPTPQQQQKEKELQEREQKVAKTEATAKDQEHSMQMAAKDAEMEAQRLSYQNDLLERDRRMFEQEQRFIKEVTRLEKEVQDGLREAAMAAEIAVRDAAQGMQPEGAMQ